jgi:hypothetical protein
LEEKRITGGRESYSLSNLHAGVDNGRIEAKKQNSEFKDLVNFIGHVTSHGGRAQLYTHYVYLITGSFAGCT